MASAISAISAISAWASVGWRRIPTDRRGLRNRVTLGCRSKSSDIVASEMTWDDALLSAIERHRDSQQAAAAPSGGFVVV